MGQPWKTYLVVALIIGVLIGAGVGWFSKPAERVEVPGVTVTETVPGPTVTKTVTATPPRPKQILVIGTTTTCDIIDPALGWSWPAYIAHNLIFDTLVGWKEPETVEVTPELAKSWIVSSDGKTFDFLLIEDVKFHDGNPFDATCVKYSIDRHKEIQGPLAFFFDDVIDVDVVDTYHVRINLKSPAPSTFLKILGGDLWAGIVSPSAVEKYGDAWGKTAVVGTGPFKFVEWVKGDRIVLVRNDEYWGKKPVLEKIIIKIMGDPTSARLALEKGEIDMFYKYPLPSDILPLKENPDIEHQSQATEYLNFLMFNQKCEPLDNKLVRQAIAYAINVERTVKVAFKGEGDIAYSLVQSWMKPYHEPAFEKYTYNPEKAKALLAEAGFPEGFKTTLYYPPKKYGPAIKDVVMLIQEDLKAVGIDCDVEMVEWGTYVEKAFGEEPEMPITVFGWCVDYPDPDNVLMQVVHPEFGYYYKPLGGWENDRFVELGRIGRASMDPNERVAVYKEAQQILAEEVPVYPIIERSRWIFYRNWVKGFDLYPCVYGDDQSLLEVYIEEH